MEVIYYNITLVKKVYTSQSDIKC